MINLQFFSSNVDLFIVQNFQEKGLDIHIDIIRIALTGVGSHQDSIRVERLRSILPRYNGHYHEY